MQFRWNPSKGKESLSTQVRIEDEDWSGRMRAVILKASGSPEHDKLAVRTCQSTLDDFPRLGWWGTKYTFNSGAGVKSVGYAGPGSIGYLALLAKYGNEPLGDAESVAENYVQTRWTTERIRDFCRFETRLPRCLRSPNLGFGGHRRIEGVAVPQPAPEIGSLYWWAGVVNGLPSSYVITVTKDDAFWMLEAGKPSYSSSGDNEFVMRRISDSLFNSIMFFELANVDRLNYKKWKSRRKALPEMERLIRGENGRIIAYECELNGGSTVRASIDNSSSIGVVYVDGVPDRVWNQAIAEHPVSFKKLDEYGACGYKLKRTLPITAPLVLERIKLPIPSETVKKR